MSVTEDTSMSMALTMSGLLESENSECEFAQHEVMKPTADGYDRLTGYMDDKFDGSDFISRVQNTVTSGKEELSSVIDGVEESNTMYESESRTKENLSDTLEEGQIPIKGYKISKNVAQNNKGGASYKLCTADELLYEFLDDNFEGFPLEDEIISHEKLSNGRDKSGVVSEHEEDDVLVEYLDEELDAGREEYLEEEEKLDAGREDETEMEVDSGVAMNGTNSEELNILLGDLTEKPVPDETEAEPECGPSGIDAIQAATLAEEVPESACTEQNAEGSISRKTGKTRRKLSVKGNTKNRKNTHSRGTPKGTSVIEKLSVDGNFSERTAPRDKTAPVIIMQKKSVNGSPSNSDRYNRLVVLPRGIISRDEMAKTSAKIPIQIINKSHVCEICNETFLTRGDYSTHKENVHFPGQRLYACDVCNKSFMHEPYYKAHLRTHSAETKHVCQQCGKIFLYKNALNVHSRVHTREKPYLCEICKKGFSVKGALRAHIKIHDPNRIVEKRPPSSQFSCPICLKCFSRKGLLTPHMRYHNGEKPYSCQYCEKKFVIKSNKDQHERIHSKVRPFECKMCGKAFTQAASRNKHEKTHNKPPTLEPLHDDSFNYEYHRDDMDHQVKVALEAIEVSPVDDFDVSEFWTPQD